MSKAQELATSLDDLGAAIPYCTEAATLLRTQDALLRQALEALDVAFAYDDDVFGVHHNSATDTFLAIQEHLK